MAAISKDMLQAFASHDNLEKATEVVLREQGLNSCKGLERCPNLQSASLAHNTIQSIDFVQPFKSLMELNLSHNAIRSLQGLEKVPNLRRLFCNSNGIEDLKPLLQCPSIRLLDVRSNRLQDVNVAIANLSRLTALDELEIMGNPCCVPGTSAMLISGLRLRTLDGELVTSIDREKALERTQSDVAMPTPPRRPPSQSGSRRGRQGQMADEQNLDRPRTAGRAAVENARVQMEGLSSHPLVMEYLAQAAVESSGTPAADSSEMPPAPEGIPSRPNTSHGRGKRQFVKDLRSITNSMSAATEYTPQQIAAMLATQTDEHSSLSSILRVALGSDSEEGNGGQSIRTNSLEDCHRAIRRLLKTVEVLQSEREALKHASTSGGAAPRLVELEAEAAQLRAENANMYSLLEENKQLQVQLEATTNKVKQSKLVEDHKKLREAYKKLRAKYEDLKSQMSRQQLALARPQTPAASMDDVLGNGEDFDKELTQLIRKNSEMLAQLRKDVQETKDAFDGRTPR